MRASTHFVCQQCGYSTPRWMGQCPGCGQWNSLVETIVEQSKFKHARRSLGEGGSKVTTGGAQPIKLSSVKKTDYQKRMPTGIAELDRVLGGGIVPGMVTLVAGEPGIGKSTLLLELAGKAEGNVVYVAGEESVNQIANRASRLGLKGENITVLEETDVEEVISVLTSLSTLSNLGLIVIDSIQTLTTEDLTGTAGSIGQVRETASRLAHFAKQTGTPVFIVGHVTKEGTIAGPRVLEHMVDTVLWFEGERQESLRILRAVKNRFGATDEVGIFSMEERGLVEVANPSELFLGNMDKVSGSVATAILEGTRVLLIEVQALVVATKLAFPKRVGRGIDSRRLELLVAVLTRRAGLPLWDFDIFVNVAGGIAVSEPAADLAIALSIASAFQDKPMLSGTCAIGEVGLLGEVREVPMQERRLKEARRLGFINTVTKKEARTVGEAINKFVIK